MFMQQVKALFFVALILSAEGSRQNPSMMENLQAGAGGGGTDSNAPDNQAAANTLSGGKSSDLYKMASGGGSLAALNYSQALDSDRELDRWACDEYCITCPVKYDQETGAEVQISWYVKRTKGSILKFAGGVFVAGLLTLGVVTGVLVVPVFIAGAAAAVGISTGAAVVGGTLAGAYLVRDFLKEKRTCPNVEFREVNHANKQSWFKKHEAEESYQLDEVNLLELMSQMEDAKNEEWFQDYERNTNVPEKERLTGLMACNLLRIDQKKWGDMRYQDANFRKLMGMFRNSENRPSSVTATIAECSKWLCSKKFEDADFKETQVKEMGSNWHGMSKCGERSNWNVKSWWR